MITAWKLSKLERIHQQRASSSKRAIKHKAAGVGLTNAKKGFIKHTVLQATGEYKNCARVSRTKIGPDREIKIGP